MTARCANTSFVTLLANERYSAAAICLPMQLRRVHAACPLLLIYNDADASLIGELPRLLSSFGASNVLPLSKLKARYARSRRRNAPSKRRLFDGGRGLSNTHLKLWLWALPVKRAVFLDIDILVLRNVDELLRIGPEAPNDIGSVTCKSKFGDRFFNTGMMIFSPSLRMLHKLLEVERFASWPWNGHIPREGERWPDVCAPAGNPGAAARMFPNSTNALRDCRGKYGPGRQPGMMSKACESKLTDQSIINHVYRTHKAVWGSFNDATKFRLETSHIIHFVGEPKPWEVSTGSRRRGVQSARMNATRLWQSRCAHVAT